VDWAKVYDLIDRHVIKGAERHRADVQRIEAEVARERRRIDIERRMDARRRVMEGIVSRGVFWPRDW